MNESFEQIYKDKKVLITGHTGFKGSWLGLWLCRMGAKLVGYALDAPTNPSHYELLELDCLSIIGDIRDGDKLEKVIEQEQPEIIFHLAAQSLVRQSYQEPVVTFSTNIMGTVNLLNACRKFSCVRAIVVVTSDKCYENREFERGYSEEDAMGGHDPYSASKGCTEIVTSSYRRSFFPLIEYGKEHTTLLASARAGNVIGGGDWAKDRLIPDIVRAASKNETVFIRSPSAIRPWQHVLESLSGYLILGGKLLDGNAEFARGWNFGPSEGDELTVAMMVEQLQQHWGRIVYQRSGEHNPHEANLLKLDSSKAHLNLGWSPVWGIDKTLEMTAKWYRHFYEHGKVISKEQLVQYVQTMKQENVECITL